MSRAPPPSTARAGGSIAGRALLVRRAQMLPIECIVRGYLAGQAYDEYAASGTVHGTPMPAGLRLADRFDAPMFTPSTKAEVGHDLNIGLVEATELVGAEAALEARAVSLALFERAARRVEVAGFVLADTKFELGLRRRRPHPLRRGGDPRLLAAVAGRPGGAGHHPAGLRQAAAAGLGGGRGLGQAPPPPPLPPEVVRETSERYVAAYERVTGRRLADWYGAGR